MPFFITRLSQITEPKNKKMQNSIIFHFYIHVMTKKSTTYAKFGKKRKNDQNWIPRATGLS